MNAERLLTVGLAVALVLAASVGLGAAQEPVPDGTAFTYQGRLMDGGSPANGSYDLEFRLYDDTGTLLGRVPALRPSAAGSIAWNPLYLDGSGTSLLVADGQTVTFNILVVGRSSAGESAGYSFWGAIENQGGTLTVVSMNPFVAEDDATWGARVIASDPLDALTVQVLGDGVTAIRWVATVRTAEVSW